MQSDHMGRMAERAGRMAKRVGVALVAEAPSNFSFEGGGAFIHDVQPVEDV